MLEKGRDKGGCRRGLFQKSLNSDSWNPSRKTSSDCRGCLSMHAPRARIEVHFFIIKTTCDG